MLHVTIILLCILGLACGDSETGTAPEPAPVSSGLEAEETSTAAPAPEEEEPTIEAQSYAQALELICNDVMEAEEVRDATPETKAVIMHEYISDRLTNQEARDLYASLAEMETAQKHETISNAAEQAGLSHCTIAELWAEP